MGSIRDKVEIAEFKKAKGMSDKENTQFRLGYDEFRAIELYMEIYGAKTESEAVRGMLSWWKEQLEEEVKKKG